MSGLEIIFWASAVFLVFTYVGYPLALAALAALRRPTFVGDDTTPKVTVVIAAYNEADCIRQKIDNLLASDYPSDAMDIIVASDGSTDATVANADGAHSPRVRTIAFAERCGKASVLNHVIPEARGDIVVLADARQRFDSGALRALVRHFANPQVGAVGGELILIDTQAKGSEVVHGVSAYWRYEKFIRRNESRIDSTVGVSGAIYALRRELFEPIPTDTILDDVLIPMRVVARGYRVLLESTARAYDRTAPTADAEYRRKVRTLAGNFQLFARERWLLNPMRNRLWLQTFAHKFCRLLGPFALAMAFVASALLSHDAVYAVLFGAQVLFYAGAVVGLMIRDHHHKSMIFNLPYTFCLLNWATVVGLTRWLGDRQSVMWQPNNVR